MTTDVTVRDLRPGDDEELAAITVDAYRSLLGDDLDGGYVAELADVAGRARLADILVAVDVDGSVVGGITYIDGPGSLAWFDGHDEVGLRMLAVAPGAQGHGVGTALVDESVRRAAATGRQRILLHTTAPMTTAHRLYERAGFRRDPDHDRVLLGGLQLIAYALDLGLAQ